MTKINLHGILGEKIKKQFDLEVNSVAESIHAINILTSGNLYKTLINLDKKNIRFKILINNKIVKYNNQITEKNIKEVFQTELVANFNQLKTVDIVPVIEGAEDIFEAILGVILIVIGAFAGPLGITISQTLQGALIIGGLGLVAGGIISLLSSPPKFEDFREIDGSTGRTSYLFNGPQNTTREGGPVPVGYGRLLIGSQVISASYVVYDYDANTNASVALVQFNEGGGGGSRNSRPVNLY